MADDVRVVTWRISREFNDLLTTYKAEDLGQGSGLAFVIVEVAVPLGMYQDQRQGHRDDLTGVYTLSVRGGKPVPLEALVERVGRDGVGWAELTLVFATTEAAARRGPLELIVDRRIRRGLKPERKGP